MGSDIASATGRTNDRALTRMLADMDAFTLQSWEDDLDFREQAKSSPAMAALLAEADAAFEATNGFPWVNPLTVEAT